MRRKFLKVLASIPAAVGAITLLGNQEAYSLSELTPGRLKTSLNAFSFNAPLTDKSMNLDDLLEFSAATGFEGVDITAYYFPGYPVVPPDEYLYHIKHKAFRLGLNISGTGVRNDFTDPDAVKRKEHVALIKNWIEAASKIGAPVIRIFAGNQNPAYSRDQVIEWMLNDIHACVEYGRSRGVMVAIQNHNDFIQTADQAIEIIKKINSPWFGLILDTGSYRVGDPYEEIAKTAGYAVNWQVKENVFINGVERETDLVRLVDIIKKSGYKGYLPIETLGAGDPKLKVAQLFVKLVRALA
jgi:sugar phosphate isomerase/epimerase